MRFCFWLGADAGAITYPFSLWNDEIDIPPLDLVVYLLELDPVPLPSSLIIGGNAGVYPTTSKKVTKPLLTVSVQVLSYKSRWTFGIVFPSKTLPVT